MSLKDNISRCPDIEQLAAFIDGRLEGAAHSNVVGHLDSCERCYEIFTETVRFQQETAAEVGESEPVSTAAWWQTTPYIRWAAAAVLVVGIVTLMQMRDRFAPRRTATHGLPIAALARHLVDTSTPPPSAFDASLWSYARSGSGYATGLSELERSFRLGARLVDLDVMLLRGSAEEAERLLPEIQELATSFEFSEPLAQSYSFIRTEIHAGTDPAELLIISNQAAELAEDLTNSDYFGLGKWAEAGRSAAEVGNLQLLKSEAFRSTAKSFGGLPLSGTERVTLDNLQAALASEPQESDLQQLAAAFEALLSKVGNP